MLAFASIATKTSIMMLVISVLRDDWPMGIVAVIILSVGNAGLMLFSTFNQKVERSMIDILSDSLIAIGILFGFGELCP